MADFCIADQVNRSRWLQNDFLGIQTLEKEWILLVFEFSALPIRPKWNENKGMGNSSKTRKLQMFGGDRLNQETGYNSRGCPFLKSFVRTSTGFEPVTLRYWCDVLTNWSWSIVCSRDECDRCIWNKSYKNCENEIKWRVILAVGNAIYAIA